MPENLSTYRLLKRLATILLITTREVRQIFRRSSQNRRAVGPQFYLPQWQKDVRVNNCMTFLELTSELQESLTTKVMVIMMGCEDDANDHHENHHKSKPAEPVPTA